MAKAYVQRQITKTSRTRNLHKVKTSVGVGDQKKML